MRAVLCVGNLKEAALYFDRAVPLVFTMMRGTGNDIVFHCGEEIPSRVLFDLTLGEHGYSQEQEYDIFARIWRPWEAYIASSGNYIAEAARTAGKDFFEDHNGARIYHAYEAGKFSAEVIVHAYLTNVVNPQYGAFREHVAQFAQGLGLECVDALLSHRPPYESLDTAEDTEPILTVAGLPLVDVAKVEWDQVIELRQDREAHQKLQRFRAFLVENYSGKTAAFIEDDLSRRISEYEYTVRKHGLATAIGGISVLLDSKSIHAAVSAGIAAALFGGSFAGIGTAAVVELGKVALEVSNRRREFRDWRASHELAYLINLRTAQ